MLRPMLAFGLLLAIALAGCADGEEGSPDPTPTASPTSSATNSTTAAGTTTTHTVTADDGSFDSGNMLGAGPTSTFSHTFDEVGGFPYHCEVHPSMTGEITVVEALPA